MAPLRDVLVTCRAAPNIAVIKYWGKRDEKLMLPLNDSVSCTLESDVAGTITTVAASPTFERTRLWLNGHEEVIPNRMLACLERLRQIAREQNATQSEIISWHIHICTENNFPTAAGLASSASGYACFAFTVSKLYKIYGDISGVARLGSGSASRSVLGGFVQWHAGIHPLGVDSIATEISPASHWPQMRILILVISDDKKKTASSSGMRDSVLTSDLLKRRVEHCVPERVIAIKKAIADRDFTNFGTITMKDSNQFHAVCMDTYPPCVYMNDVSHAVCDLVHAYNKDGVKIAYTFDAGPNACLYMLEDQIPYALSLIREYFPSDHQDGVEYVKGVAIEPKPLPKQVKDSISIKPFARNSIKYLIHTRVGDGPYELKDENAHLLDASGKPKLLLGS